MVTRQLADLICHPNSQWLFRAGLLLLVALEVYASLTPVDMEGIDIPHLDKLVHFLMHLGNVLLAALAFPKQRSLLIALALLFLLGPAIELLQSLTPDREASLADQLANTAGFLTGLLLARRLKRQLGAFSGVSARN